MHRLFLLALDHSIHYALQRLLAGRTGLQWSETDIARWQQEAGWAPGGRTGVRAWLDADDAYLVKKAKYDPANVAQALLYYCDWTWVMSAE